MLTPKRPKVFPDHADGEQILPELAAAHKNTKKNCAVMSPTALQIRHRFIGLLDFKMNADLF